MRFIRCSEKCREWVCVCCHNNVFFETTCTRTYAIVQCKLFRWRWLSRFAMKTWICMIFLFCVAEEQKDEGRWGVSGERKEYKTERLMWAETHIVKLLPFVCCSWWMSSSEDNDGIDWWTDEVKIRFVYTCYAVNERLEQLEDDSPSNGKMRNHFKVSLTIYRS